MEHRRTTARAPVNHRSTVVDRQWSTCQIDVSNAFLHGDLIEEVYMKPASGYTRKAKAMKDMGDLSYFLGLEVYKLSQCIFISQHKYTKEVLKERGILNNNPYKFPMDLNPKLQANVGTPLKYLKVYKRSIGKLIYAVKYLMRYLLNSPRQGIHLVNDSAVQLKSYCDSDLASCPVTRRSTTGCCIHLGDSHVSWKFDKQVVVSRSPAEAEYKCDNQKFS
ncbi:cysteine-rich receptor-like protein kinase 8 [Tanacetum coccineum]